MEITLALIKQRLLSCPVGAISSSLTNQCQETDFSRFVLIRCNLKSLL
jgi:hypothetical protein